jgi:hypothetical protein
MGAVPGAPQAPQMSVGGGFVLDIPPDATWEPFDTTDTLDKDGYYACKITKESARIDGTKSKGVFITLEIQDADAKGKIISKFLPDPRATQSNVWFIWRSIVRSIQGGLAMARSGFQYTPGAFAGQFVYVKTEAYNDDGTTRTGVGTFITKDEWQAAVTADKHRWAPTVRNPGGAGVGPLPGGLPSAFPTSAFPGLPGGPSAPTPGGAPMVQQPPMMQQPPVQMAQPPQAAPQFGAGFAAPNPFGAPPPPAAAPTAFAGAVPSQPFSAFGQPQGAPLQQPFAAAPGQQYVPPPPAPGTVPQPNITLPATLFPGTAPNGTQ